MALIRNHIVGNSEENNGLLQSIVKLRAGSPRFRLLNLTISYIIFRNLKTIMHKSGRNCLRESSTSWSNKLWL